MSVTEFGMFPIFIKNSPSIKKWNNKMGFSEMVWRALLYRLLPDGWLGKNNLKAFFATFRRFKKSSSKCHMWILLKRYNSFKLDVELIEFSINRDEFCRIYRIRKKQKKNSNSKMLTPLGSEPRASDFITLYATIWVNFPICWKSQPFRSLYSYALLIPIFSESKNQQSMNI